MLYFDYHSNVKAMIRAGRLTGWYITNKYKDISPALVLLFSDSKHKTVPIREYKWHEYLPILPVEKEILEKKKPPEE